VSEQELATDSLTASLQNRAWQVATSIALTGEDASYGMLKPAKLNYEQTTFEAAGGAGRRPTEHTVLTRFQIAF